MRRILEKEEQTIELMEFPFELISLIIKLSEFSTIRVLQHVSKTLRNIVLKDIERRTYETLNNNVSEQTNINEYISFNMFYIT